ncbi:MAG: ABC-F family ATP-binding cassette domain-containing protein [Caldilineaceae bacterium]|nr:ABC-F family ATP-binding cassette domain-containing protein [Caldilineaceae bacterium]
MIAIHLHALGVTYIAKPIFTNLSWEIHDDRCVGLVGPNGAGKSTLLRVIAGDLIADGGSVMRSSGLTVGYLRQEPALTAGITVWEEALTASTELSDLEKQLEACERRLADPAVYGNAEALAQVLEQQARLLHGFEELGGLNYQGRVRSALACVGFATELELNLLTDTLSGGQRKLLGLAKLLVRQPKLMLLDEPDNHLDMAGKALLEEVIRGYKGGVVIVSHDRYLLDVVADEIAELEDGRITVYPGNYSEFAFEKQARLLRQQQMFQAQQKEITRLEQAAKRLLIWGRTYDNEKLIKRGKAIQKRIERIDRIDKPVLERKRMGLELSGWRGSNKVLEIKDLDKVFPTENGDENIVLAGVEMLLWHGERAGLVGANGAGKSVLFRLLLGQDEPSSGEIVIGPSVRVGYYAQQHETLDYDRTLIETIRHAAPMTESSAVSFLGKFLFTYEQARSPVRTLSGGERSRLQMALLMLSNANFLLLDEPTNNLDIASVEVLEDVLSDFEGTVLVISHDRYFLDRVVGRIAELEDGALTQYIGGYSDYQEAKRENARRKLQVRKRA